jgi:hypothetical protein
MLRRRNEREIKGVLGEDKFGFRRGKEMGDKIGMVRISKKLRMQMRNCVLAS